MKTIYFGTETPKQKREHITMLELAIVRKLDEIKDLKESIRRAKSELREEK